MHDRYSATPRVEPPAPIRMKDKDLSAIRFGEDGLVPCVVQEWTTGRVLMMAYMNRQSLEKTVRTGTTWFWSRSRGTLWNKGETSGHVQKVRDLRYDCDGDTVLALVEQTGPACHTGTRTCFDDRSLAVGGERGPLFLAADGLYTTIRERKATAPPGSYTARLLAGGVSTIGAKVTEEAEEVVEAAATGDGAHTLYEAGDLLYHLLVLLAEMDIGLPELWWELERRKG
ncbi:MAG: bifunctional phosphoribosyl-AMP cyclohydrolase/phosphoribosyl-ATP diphosphatase HisIE [Thermoleophilia bacterium]|nr:bifunctional phosphoribosyl-AMP cyclohydrolase/phosphoribosyl-ATP diphosphatase HisIE [Thermoleophilia bacterium]